MRYIVVDADGLITNVCEWDGKAEWSPPDGQTAAKSDVGSAGDSYIGGKIIHAPISEPVPPVPTFEQMVAQASTFEELKALVAAR